MKTSGMRLAIASCAAAGMLFALPAAAQVTKAKLVGTWKVESVVNEMDGKKTELFGAKPVGYFMFQPDGHFSTQIVNPSRAKYAANSRMKATADEQKQTIEGTITTFGTYKLNEKDGTLNLHIIGSSYPNWDGTDQVRKASVTGDDMTYTNPTASTGGSAVLKLKKVK
jgi:hypothetical protein